MNQRKSSTTHYHFIRNKTSTHKQRMGFAAPIFGFLLLTMFAIFLLPLFLFMLVFNKIYFWVRNQHSISLRPYLNFNRHKIAHLGFADRIWCEYCEWANGSLQWMLDIVNEIERRYCPIKTQCDPHCGKAKQWREEFLEFDHKIEDLEKFMFEGQYERISICEKNE